MRQCCSSTGASASSRSARPPTWSARHCGTTTRRVLTCVRTGAVRSTAEVFPRAPLLRPGQLTLNPFAAGGDVHFLGEQVDGAFPFTQSDGERALFLDFRGWWEEGARPELGNEPGKVQETTQNRWAFVERLVQSWAPWRPEDPAELHSARGRHDGAVQAPIVSRCSRLAELGGRSQSGGSRSDIDAEQDRESCRQHESLVHLLSFLLPRP